MTGVLEIVIVLILAAAVALLISRFPDTRKTFGQDADDALYRGSARGLWFFVVIVATALAALWLLS
jgi:hypothetical protein